jgi:transposase-like protein
VLVLVCLEWPVTIRARQLTASCEVRVSARLQWLHFEHPVILVTMRTEPCDDDIESLPLRKGWSKTVRHAVLNVICLVRVAMLAGRDFLVQNGDVLEAHVHRLETELALLREELGIIGTRMARIAPQRRPQYSPVERMASMELRAMRGWSKAETARRFFVTDATIRSWLRRADDEDSLLQLATPVNRFPDFIRHAAQQIKLFCPSLGKVKIAEMLSRVSASQRSDEFSTRNPLTHLSQVSSRDSSKSSRIVAKYPNHTWHADTTPCRSVAASGQTGCQMYSGHAGLSAGGN